VAYDAAWAYELAYVMRDALRRMYGSTAEHPDGENIFYYLTIYNEPYVQAPEPADFPGGTAALEQGILRGLYRYAAAPGADAAPAAQDGQDGQEANPADTADLTSVFQQIRQDVAGGGPVGGRPASPAPAAGKPGNGSDRPRARVLASGVALRWALGAQKLLDEDWGVAAEVWSATSWTELRRDAMACDEWNLLNPDAEHRVPFVTRSLEGSAAPVVAVSDWIRAVPDQISRWVPAPYTSLGTDGYGFSDTRPAARRFFHVDAESITLAVLSQLVRQGEVKPEVLGQAISKYRLDLDVSDAL
jgi:pyruvate dehydrogenase E1 component